MIRSESKPGDEACRGSKELGTLSRRNDFVRLKKRSKDASGQRGIKLYQKSKRVGVQEVIGGLLRNRGKLLEPEEWRRLKPNSYSRHTAEFNCHFAENKDSLGFSFCFTGHQSLIFFQLYLGAVNK